MAQALSNTAITLPIFVISLRRSDERRALMNLAVQRMGIPFTFFDAIDAQRCEHSLQRHYRPQHSLLRKTHHLRGWWPLTAPVTAGCGSGASITNRQYS